MPQSREPSETIRVTQPVTAAEHGIAYREHKARADTLKLMIDGGLVEGLDPAKHQRLVSEYHEELMCAARHFTLKAFLAVIGEDEDSP